MLTKPQRRALEILYYAYSAQTPATIPDAVKATPEWMALQDITNKKWHDYREALWLELKPLIGRTTGKPAQSARRKK